LTSAQAAAGEGDAAEATNDDDEDDDEFGDDDDEQEYSSAEIPVVQHAVEAMTLSFRLVKLSLGVMTAVADYAENNAAVPSSVFSFAARAEPFSASSNSSSSSASSASANGLMTWVSEIVSSCNGITAAVTDYGCELYPPIAVEALDGPRGVLLGHLRHLAEVLHAVRDQAVAAQFLDEIVTCADVLNQTA
jgi:hypothetical protein